MNFLIGFIFGFIIGYMVSGIVIIMLKDIEKIIIRKGER
jgi:hypothetical protein